MKLDVSGRVLLFIFALLVVGLKFGYDISQSQLESSGSNVVQHSLAHQLREAKQMLEEDLLSEYEFQKYRQQLLGLPAASTATDSVEPEARQSASSSNEQPKPAAPKSDTKSGELPPLPEVSIQSRLAAAERLKSKLGPSMFQNGGNRDSDEAVQRAPRPVASKRETETGGAAALNDDALFRQKKLDTVLKPQLLPKTLKNGGVEGKYDFAGQSLEAPDSSYPTVKGVAYSPDKHPLQGGSLLVSSCPDREASHKFIFIKTHKTGSSTITNLFHRFGLKYGLNMALPKDNMFYGWPSPGISSIRTVQEIGVYKAPFDIYASAHSVYSPSFQNKLVQNANYITILRSPMSHFRSAFRYWQIGQSIMSRGKVTGTGANGLITPEDFFKNPEQTAKYHKLIGMPGLISNSFAYDLGIQSKSELNRLKSSPDALKAKIAEFESALKFVVITDYMEESLLLLKREMCWQIDDVVIGAMKVTPRAPGTPEPPRKTKEYYMKDPLFQNVIEYNWLDTALYDHFNNTLWSRIDAERKKAAQPGQLSWDEELAELKARVATFSKMCAPLNYPHEDRHRAELEKPDLPSTERLCHLAYTDSKGYCKTFKREQGAAVDEIECYAQRRLQKWVLLRMGNGADETLFNSMASGAMSASMPLRHRNTNEPFVYTPAAADSNVRSGTVVLDKWTRKDVTVARNPTTFSASRNSGSFSMSGVRGLRFSKKTFDAMGGAASMFSYVAQHPVQDFADAWKALRISERLALKSGRYETMSQFFARDVDVVSQRQRLRAALDEPLKADALDDLKRDGFCDYRLMNRLACRFGFNPDDNSDQKTVLQRYRSQRANLFQVPLLAEYMEESLVLIRHTICWSTSDFSKINTELWKSATLQDIALKDSSSPLRKAIEAIIPMDMTIYNELERAFWLKLAQRPGTKAELPILKNAITQHQQNCETILTPNTRSKSPATLRPVELACLMSTMDEESFVPIVNGKSHLSGSKTVHQFEPDPCLQALDIIECERTGGKL